MSEKVHRADFGAPLPERRRVLAPSRARDVPSAGAIHRRHRLVQAVKLLLPLAAAGLLALLLLWPEFEGRDGRLSFRRGPALVPEALQLVAPRFQGVDELGRPYTITARVGRQVGQEEVMLLDQPRADILLNDGAWVYVEADNGRYDKPAHHLNLEGNVRIFHDNGMLFRTEQAAVQIDQGSADGDRPTQAQGSFGTIESEGFRLRERGAVMVFTGKAHAVLEGRQR
ncbi:LPS export ABC transporter periplasmic protein LptC [Roseococcus sp. SYP-B2431]|uniref:LPS export ABC transporter periplasmic protein LptC n=1 Tax=Roseococcus sp. SYP-B2431 TaxID=2496640 RepID=UPI00103DE3D6|nr:LPS export ABC transporter periplasmic protein LptC [Roseococcus sp. SYP-B2431]TCI00251.1 LPS export ABC transporter periplasmic protein LptC [Roseococcus sp. SYP-B2431]